MKDTTIAATNVIKQADKLFSEREHFETVTLTRTNEELYGLLSQVYSLYKSAAQNENCLKESVDSMRQKLKERNIVTQANTPCITVFVRYIFNSDRKRSYNYTQTLLAAIDQDIAPADLSAFITDNDGVEEIKRTGNMSVDKLKAKDDLDKAFLTVQSELESMPTCASVDLPDSSVVLSDGTKYTFIIARKNTNGKMDLLCTVPKTTVALEKLAFKALAKRAVEQDAENIVTVKMQAKNVAIKAAAKSISKAEYEIEAA